jgi:hypothetical protein
MLWTNGKNVFLTGLCLFSIDKIAIPDFGTGAMENWGLVTYRETNLLYDPQESASSNQQRVASVIAHELVHQVKDIRIKSACFGNWLKTIGITQSVDLADKK